MSNILVGTNLYHSMAKVSLNKTEKNQDQNYHSIKADNLGEHYQQKLKISVLFSVDNYWNFLQFPNSKKNSFHGNTVYRK